MLPECFANSTLTPHRQNGIVTPNYRLLQFNFETALYGYLNKVRSSRCLERETQRNLEVIWMP